MYTLNPEVDLYLADGCGRCKYYATPDCKVKKWLLELEMLRQIALESGLVEELKWKVPVYTFSGKNVIIVSAFKDYSSIAFIKGALLKDPEKILVKQGEHSQSGRIAKFTDTTTIQQLSAVLKAYILEAIELEKAGEKVEMKKNPEPIPEELENKFAEMPELKKAFFALTPGKQRAYIIHFSQPKQSQTRVSRIENNVQKILNGEAFYDKPKPIM